MRDDARIRAEQALAERNAKRRAKHTVRTWDAYRGSDAASPIIGGRSGAADPPPSPIQVGGGAHIELECDGHPLDGTPVEFDTVVDQDGWRASMPRSTFHFPLGGYYDLGETWVEFAPADVWKGDVDFRLFVNGTLRRARTVYATELGVPIPHLQIGNVNAGDEWHIEFEATAIATSPGPVPAPTKIHSIMQLVDRQVGEVNDAAPQTLIQELGTVNEGSGSPVSVGWAFDVGPGPVTVVGLRVWMPVAVTRTLYLWGSNQSDPLGTVEVTTVPDQWVSGPITPVTLDPGAIGTLSVPVEGEPFYRARLSTGTVVEHPNVTYRNGRFSNSQLNPGSVSSTEDALFGVVDAIVEDGG